MNLLDGGNEGTARSHVAVSHARSVESEAGIALAIEKNQAAGGVGALSDNRDSVAGSYQCGGSFAGNGFRGIDASERMAEKVNGRFGHNNLHDGFAVAGGRNRAGFAIGVTTGADERGIPDAPGKLAAGAAGGGCSEELAVAVNDNGTDGTLLVAAVMLGGVFILLAFRPGFALGGTDQLLRIAERNPALLREAFRAIGNEHHVTRMFENRPGKANWVFYALEASSRASTKVRAIHDDGVAFDAAIKIQMRAVTRIEDRFILEDDHSGFDGVEGRTTARKNRPSRRKSAFTSGIARWHRFIRNVPGAAMNDQRRFHRNEDGKGTDVCPEKQSAQVADRRSKEEIDDKENKTNDEQDDRAMDAVERETLNRAEKGG